MNCKQWNVFGFGSPSFKTLFDTAVDSAHKNDIYMSFALGASQGQGAPAKIESEGLAKELVSCCRSCQTFFRS